MSKSAPNNSSQGFLSSAKIKQAFSLEHPRKSLRLAKMKATNEEPKAETAVGESLVLTEPSTNLVGSSSGYSKSLS